MDAKIREQIEKTEIKSLTHPFATRSCKSSGRQRNEEEDPIRPCFERDAHRILYSTAFRRLRYKTQVFFNPEHDHITTRVDHSLFVASISYTVSRSLGLNTDLAYAIALGHDIGHGPFGHAGEEIIQNLARKVDEKFSFQHEIHGLRVVDKLTFQPSTREHGLNLTYEVRDGIACHWGEDNTQYALPREEKNKLDLNELREKGTSPCTQEACVVRMVDRIAYVGRDVEDAMMVLKNLPSLPDGVTSALGSDNRSIINTLVTDLINESDKNRKEGKVGFSKEVFGALGELYKYNMENIYRHPRILDYEKKAKEIMRKIFENARAQLDSKERTEWGHSEKEDPYPVRKLHQFIGNIYLDEEKNKIKVLETIVDYLSLMTDRFALKIFGHLAIPEPFKEKERP
ncbi:MAG: HD domain-containing protein [candidate division Zixibacteria bacterium]|nr:HD domain-containing protein [candidate division Zixibacteria bacterium]